MRTPDGDVSVPITHAYNHHYCAYMSGAMSEMKQVVIFSFLSSFVLTTFSTKVLVICALGDWSYGFR